MRAQIDGTARSARTSATAWERLAVPGAVAVAGIVLALVTTGRGGATLTADSVYYISAARNLLAGRGFTCFDGGPLLLWPPLFPCLLAGLGRLGFEPVTGARLLNTLAFGIVLFIGGILFERNTRNRAVAAVATLAVIASPAFFDTVTVVWTEPVFSLLLALLAVFVGRLAAGGRLLDLLPVVVLTALAPLQRYIGLVIIPAVGLAIILTPELSSRRRVAYSAMLCILSSLPLVLWVARNSRLSGTLTGERPSMFTALGPSALALSRGVLGWFLPAQVGRALGAFSVVLVIALAVLTAWLVVAAIRRRRGSGPAQVRFALITVLLYATVVLVAGSAGSAYETQYDRFMAPVFFLAILLLAVAAERIIHSVGHRPRSRLPIRALVLAAGVLVLAFPAWQLATGIRRAIRTGSGGEGSRWKQSQVLEWLKAHPVSGRILSNDPAGVYFMTGAEAHMSPRRGDDPARLRKTGAVTTGDYLIWVKGLNRPYLMRPGELARQFGLDLVASTPDGWVAVFR